MGTLPGGAASPGALSPTARPAHGHAPQRRRCAAGLGASSPAARPAQGRSSPAAQPAQGRSSQQRGQPSSRRISRPAPRPRLTPPPLAAAAGHRTTAARHPSAPRRASSRKEEVDGLRSTDAARVSSLQRRIDKYNRLITTSSTAAAAVAVTASKAQVPVTSGAKLRTLNYVATVGLGDGEATVIVDTASELTWVQCAPCESCHDQQGPLFDPSSSPSYAAVPCNSSSCDALQLAMGGMSGAAACSGADGGQDQQQPAAACSYTLSYRDGSYSRGVLAHDRLSLAGEVIDGFVFGCGTSNQGPPFGGTSGLMGLGRSQLSLVSQTMDQFGGVFS
ncbi:aspartyl protease family protein At5g10770-like [Miscanthus floridulus]|uniref:aspartyl protease family protein At5g10770-like n=1 Tax=Miscanthus floridulus TaxID=154761 RepID=UPI003457F290